MNGAQNDNDYAIGRSGFPLRRSINSGSTNTFYSLSRCATNTPSGGRRIPFAIFSGKRHTKPSQNWKIITTHTPPQAVQAQKNEAPLVEQLRGGTIEQKLGHTPKNLLLATTAATTYTRPSNGERGPKQPPQHPSATKWQHPTIPQHPQNTLITPPINKHHNTHTNIH